VNINAKSASKNDVLMTAMGMPDFFDHPMGAQAYIIRIGNER
jgi:hypothetical protein